MKELIELIARKLVEHPESVQVCANDSDEGLNIELRVHPEDMGRVIGKEGRTAKAIRTVLASAATKQDKHVQLQIVE